MVLNFFWHPVYIARNPECREAVDELVRLMREMDVPPVLMGPDEVSCWWEARAKGIVEAAEQDGRSVCFEACCEYGRGFVVKVPTGDAPARACLVDGGSGAFENAHEFGQQWAFIPLSPGRHRIELEL